MKIKDTTQEEAKVTIRLPKFIIDRIRMLAIEHQRSLNSEMIVALQQYVAKEHQG